VAERVVDTESNSIDYRLNQLGIRLWQHYCQLISKHKGAWVTIGPIVELPVNTPKETDELLSAWSDPIKMTAFQFMQEHPESDLSDLLLRKKAFQDVLTCENGFQQLAFANLIPA